MGKLYFFTGLQCTVYHYYFATTITEFRVASRLLEISTVGNDNFISDYWALLASAYNFHALRRKCHTGQKVRIVYSGNLNKEY